MRDDVCVSDVAAAFQDAVTDSLAATTCRAASDFAVNAVYLSGGVSANQMLRSKLAAALEVPVFFPLLSLCTDNAAMIGAAAHFRYLAGHRSGLDFEARASWRLNEDVYAD